MAPFYGPYATGCAHRRAHKGHMEQTDIHRFHRSLDSSLPGSFSGPCQRCSQKSRNTPVLWKHCQSLSECASREGGEPIPSTRSQCRILHSLWFPAPLCVWAHDTLTQPVNPAKNEPRKQWVVSFQASTELACHIIRHVLELVPVQSCEAGLPICVIPRVPAECKQRGSGTGPEKGIKLSHLLSKQPNQCMNHPQEALVMPTIHITQHPSRKACNSGRLLVKIKTAAISHFGVPMTFLSLSTPQF